MDPTPIIGDSLLFQNGVFLGASALAFYAGMRWPRHALKLAALLLPLAICASAWTAGEFMAAQARAVELPMAPGCGEDERCRARFAKAQERARRAQVRALFGATVLPLLMVAILALLVRRDRSVRQQLRTATAGERPLPNGPTERAAASDGTECAVRRERQWWQSPAPAETDAPLPLPRGQRDDGDARWMPPGSPGGPTDA